MDGADNDLHEDVEFASAAGQSDVLPQEAEGRYDNQDEVEDWALVRGFNIRMQVTRMGISSK